VSTPEAIGTLVSPALGSSGAVPVINEALEPASVRDGSPALQQDYDAALSFESVLVNQLAQQLVASSGLSGNSSDNGSDDDGDDSSDSSDPAVSDMTSLIPGALTNSIMSDGGLGLAAQLLPSFEGTNATDPTSSVDPSAVSGQSGTQA
jgi:hypothetical protein